MSKFKRGEKVVCVSTDGGYERYLTIGKIYEIDIIFEGHITNLYHLRVKTDIGEPMFVAPLEMHFLTPNDFKKYQRKEKLNILNLL